MTKYLKEFKLEVAKYFNITSKTMVSEWVRRYKENGVEGLLKNRNFSYS